MQGPDHAGGGCHERVPGCRIEAAEGELSAFGNVGVVRDLVQGRHAGLAKESFDFLADGVVLGAAVGETDGDGPIRKLRGGPALCPELFEKLDGFSTLPVRAIGASTKAMARELA